VAFGLACALAFALALAVGAGARRMPRHLAALAKMWKDDKFGSLPSW
jgi:hypothetical protein